MVFSSLILGLICGRVEDLGSGRFNELLYLIAVLCHIFADFGWLKTNLCSLQPVPSWGCDLRLWDLFCISH